MRISDEVEAFSSTVTELNAASATFLTLPKFRSVFSYYYNSVDRDGEKMVTGISELSYHMDEDTYRRAYQQCDRIVQEVVSGAAGLSAREAELHAYRYVTGHCVYDLSTPY